MTRTTSCWWADPARARRIWPRPSACRASLVNVLEQEKAQGKAGRIALSFLRARTTSDVIDALRCVPLRVAQVSPMVERALTIGANSLWSQAGPGDQRSFDGIRIFARATDGPNLGHRWTTTQKRPLEVGVCCWPKPVILWLRGLDGYEN